LAGVLAVLVVVGALAWVARLLFPGEPRLDVQVTPGGVRLALDERGSEVSATIDNPNPVPVDVTVLAMGHDITDRLVVQEMAGPYRRIPPGGPHVIQARLDATPLERVSFKTLEVRPSDPADLTAAAPPSRP
jgi:hypothetical protein